MKHDRIMGRAAGFTLGEMLCIVGVLSVLALMVAQWAEQGAGAAQPDYVHR